MVVEHLLSETRSRSLSQGLDLVVEVLGVDVKGVVEVDREHHGSARSTDSDVRFHRCCADFLKGPISDLRKFLVGPLCHHSRFAEGLLSLQLGVARLVLCRFGHQLVDLHVLLLPLI